MGVVVDVAESGEWETDSEFSAGEAVVEGTIDVRGVDVAAKITGFSVGSSIPFRLLYTAKSETTAMIAATKASIAATVLPEPDLPELGFLEGLTRGWRRVRV